MIVAVLTGALVFAVATEGGRNARTVRPLSAELDRVAELVGLGIRQINLSGHRMTPDADIFDALDLKNVGSLLRFDSSAARERLERLAWVQTAAIQRVFPDEISIAVTERKPYAVWQKTDGDVLIDAEGRELALVARGTVTGLPVVAGAGAATNAQALFKMLAGYPELMSRLAVAERIGDRRWSLKLTHGPEIDLPADAEAEALARLMARRRGGRLIDRDVAGLDLRVADQIVVRRDPVKTSRAAARPH